MKYKHLFIILFFVSMQLNATAFNSCLIEKTIVKFMSDFTKCSLNIKTNYLMLVSKVGDDYSDVVPEILGTDIEASVTLNICKSDQKYYFWLRKNKNSTNQSPASLRGFIF